MRERERESEKGREMGSECLVFGDTKARER